jgi:FemAB-related protein (PEP-CTERM system-associated)
MAVRDAKVIPPQRPAGSANSLRVEVCDDSWAKRWDAYLHETSRGSFYHLFGWRLINAKNFNHTSYYLAAVEGEHLRGIMPLTLISSRLFGRILCSLPFVNYGGPCTDDHAASSALVDTASCLADRKRSDYLEIRASDELPVDLPNSQHKVSMTIPLDSDPGRLWDGFTSKHRTNIRRAYKNDLQVVSGGPELLDSFYAVISESWRSLGTPIYRKDYFRSILDEFPDFTRIFVCRHRGRAIAAAFNGYFNGTVEGMWAGVHQQFRQLQPNYVLYWAMIEDACERGFRHFHLGRSSIDSGGESFKKKWNAEARQLYWYYYLPRGGSLPRLNVTNPKYELAISLWRRLPTKVTTLIGPLIAKSIP